MSVCLYVCLAVCPCFSIYLFIVIIIIIVVIGTFINSIYLLRNSIGYPIIFRTFPTASVSRQTWRLCHVT